MSATTRLPVHPAWFAPRPAPRNPDRPAGDGTIASLTDRERDTLRAVCELGTAPRAAAVLGASRHTVVMCLRAVSSKLGLYVPGDQSARLVPLCCYRLGRWDEMNGVESGWFADDEEEDR